MPIQAQVRDLLYGKTGYVKKLIEDCNNAEDTCKLLRVGPLPEYTWNAWKWKDWDFNFMWIFAGLCIEFIVDLHLV